MSKIIVSTCKFALSADNVYNMEEENEGFIDCNVDFRRDIKNSSGLHVDCMSFLPNAGSLIALCVQKNLYLFNYKEDKILGSCEIPKTAVVVRVFNSEPIILIGDRSGTVTFFRYSNDLLSRERQTFGHNSILTDALISPNDKFIITSDRDEKIRVTCYPNVYNIQCYCLGHKQFVSSLEFLPSNSDVLISCSGDGSLKLWNYLNGIELSTWKDGESKIPFIKSVSTLKEETNLVAVQLYQKNEFLLLTITSSYSVSLTEKISTSFIYDLTMKDSRLVYLTEDKDGRSLLKCITSEGLEDNIEAWRTNISKRLGNVKLIKPTEWIEMMFRKEFNNMDEYLARKKARIGES